MALLKKTHEATQLMSAIGFADFYGKPQGSSGDVVKKTCFVTLGIAHASALCCSSSLIYFDWSFPTAWIGFVAAVDIYMLDMLRRCVVGEGHHHA